MAMPPQARSLQLNNKTILTAVVVIVLVACVGAVGWRYYGQPQYTPPTTITPETKADLMTPSPLGENAMGSENAPVTIIEYASTTCPHCAHFAEATFPELKKRYIDAGKVRYIYREFPLNEVDFSVYMLTRCIAKDKFFPLLETLFQQQKQWAVKDWNAPLTNILKQAGFTDDSIKACLSNQQVYDGVKWSRDQGVRLGVDSTPTFFINGKIYVGGMEIADLEKIIMPLLGNAEAAGSH